MVSIIREENNNLFSLLKSDLQRPIPYTADVIGIDDFKVFQCPTGKIAILTIEITPKSASTMQFYQSQLKVFEWKDYTDRILIDGITIGPGQTVYLLTMSEFSNVTVKVTGQVMKPEDLVCLL